MTRCQDRSADLLPEFIHDLLDPEDRELVEGHIESCLDCARELEVLGRLQEEVVPEPPPWFWSSLPAKVTASADKLRRGRSRAMVAAWAAGAAAAGVAALMLVLPGSVPEMPANLVEYAAVQPVGPYPVGLEEELLAASDTLLEDLDLGMDLGSAAELYLVNMEVVRDHSGYGMMDEDALRLFEDILEKMTRERVGRKVTS